jgi:hypothetical protein
MAAPADEAAAAILFFLYYLSTRIRQKEKESQLSDD